MRTLVVAVFLCACASAVGCGGDDEKAAPTTQPSSNTTSSTTITSTTTTRPDRPIGALSTEVKETPGWPDGHRNAASLTDVRVGRHEGFDRIVFEFEGSPPDYSVRFEELPVEYDPSGELVELQGTAALLVMIQAGDPDFSGPEPRNSYQGPRRIDPPRTGVLEELVAISDWEGLLQWAVGLPGQTPFAVAQLQAPPRLVVDVAHVS